MALCYIWRPQHNLAYQSTLMWSLCDVVCVVLLDTFQLLTKLLHNVVYVHICHEYIHAHIFSRPECNILISNVQIAPQRCVRPFYCSRVMFFSFTLKVNILIGDLMSCDHIEYRSSRRWHEVALHHFFFFFCSAPIYLSLFNPSRLSTWSHRNVARVHIHVPGRYDMGLFHSLCIFIYFFKDNLYATKGEVFNSRSSRL